MTRKIQKRKACYLCTTPYQVIGAIAMELEEHQYSDIYLFDDFEDYRIVGDQLKKEGIFQNVFCVDYYGSLRRLNKKMLRMHLFFRMLTCRRYYRRIVGDEIAYDYLYTSSSAISKMTIANALSVLNNDMQVILYDDGIGSYSNAKRTRTGSHLFQIARRLLKWKNILENANKLFLYEPQLMQDSSVSVSRMPKIELNSSNQELLQRIFCSKLQEDIIIKEKIIIFDTFRTSNEENDTFNALDSIYSELLNACGWNNITLKQHPRSTRSSPCKLKNFEFSSLPIEVAYMKQEDLNEKILIALNSTAVFTPKMLFDREPRIVLLYRIVGSSQEVCKKRDELYLKMAQIYTEPNNVAIPNSVEELLEITVNWMRE